MGGSPRARGKRIAIPPVLGLLAGMLSTPALGRSPQLPLDIELAWTPAGILWTVQARTDVQVLGGSLRFAPSGAASPLPSLLLGTGARRSGRVEPPGGAADTYVELQLLVRGHAGEMTVGASARRVAPDRAESEVISLPVAKESPGAPGGAGRLLGTFLYEDRLLDERGYSGRVQLLPIRQVDAALVDAASGRVLARARVGETGSLVLGPLPAAGDSVVVELRSTTYLHPDWDIAVLDPGAGPDPRATARPHVLRTAPVCAGDSDLDLGTIVLRDSDGFGRLQAFHVLDVILDAWQALGSPAFPGPRPGRADSLRVYWGPAAAIRFTASAGYEIEIASPGRGDTDGWSDTVVLHEVAHFVTERFLRDSNPGGLHFLGDIEQEPRLAWSEGLATAIACWFRAYRAGTRRNSAGDPMDADVARFVNAGMPPPAGTPGGLQYEWDVENHLLGTTPLEREGIGSETNLAGILWDLVDDAEVPDADAADDEAVHAPAAVAWTALRGLRSLSAGAPITFEAFWDSWQRSAADPGAALLRPLLAAGRIEFVPDGAEPDAPPPRLWVTRAAESAGEVVIGEILPGPRIAVEIVNRASEPRDLGGWKLVARNNGSTGAPSLTYTLPAGTALGPGARLVVWRGGPARDSQPRWLLADAWTVPWFAEQEGALALLDARGSAADFVRWNARSGVASATPPPAGTGWSGDLPAPGFGRSLARDAGRSDSDVAADFTAANPTLGAPNDVPGVHRTFFPERDLDAFAWLVEADGAYTFAVRRLRDGARPRVELRLPGRATPLAVVAPTGVAAPLATLWLQAGDELEAWIEHTGSVTRFGVYDAALWREPDARLLLPPSGLETTVTLAPAGGAVSLAWWNAALYDSLRARGAGGPWSVLAGGARSWSLVLPRGRHRVELEAHVRGRAAAAPALLVAVEEWPDTLRDDFETLSPEVWERNGAWDTVVVPGRPGRVLADSPAGRYGDNVLAELRLRPAVAVSEASLLEFDHICIVRTEDTALLEASADWGARWESLARWDWDAHRGEGEAADWRDGRADSTDWVHETISLERFAGRPVQLRFNLTTDIYGGADGWFLDALRVVPRAATPLPPVFATRLLPNVPNPFNPGTLVRFELARPADVVLRVLDVRGRVVRVLFASPAAAGPNAVPWDGRDGRGRAVASGVYLCEMHAGAERSSRKLVVAR